ncbi:12526_t:CDS:2 [Racocetra fulgida]|uniref:12526_t:CDS:1 n=1 Tax=Racocetra fulgida TaxID=60492 RepID=A0A9N8VEX9_9GLOM|nr:12526_t:CDS:2 [Racocetra fulgida]
MNYLSKKAKPFFNPAKKKAAKALKAGQYAEAVEYYNGLIDGNPDSISMRCDRGEAYLCLNEYEKAKEDLDIYVNRKSDDERGYYLRGIVHDKLNLRVDALNDLNRALGIKPDSPFAYEALKICAKHNYELGNRDKAFQELNLILQTSTYDTWALETRGKMYYENKQYQEALQDFNSFLDIQPVSINILELRGNIYRKLGLSNKALTDYNQALKINPNDPNILINCSKTYLVQKQYSDALRVIEKFLYYGGELNASVLKNRGLIYAGLSRHNDAITDFTMSLEKNEKGTTYRHRAKVYQALKQYKEALADLNKALILDDSDKESLIMRNQAEIYKEQKNYEKAIEVLAKGLENAPGDTNMLHLFVVKGDIHRLRKEFAESLENLNNALSLDLNAMEIDSDEPIINDDKKKYNALALCYRGSIHRNNKDYVNALKDLDGSLKKHPKNIFALCERGAVYRDKGNFKDAWNDIENALKLSEENDDDLE